MRQGRLTWQRPQALRSDDVASRPSCARLRGTRTGGAVAKALGWSPAKVSRYELGQSSFPLEEIEKLLDFYGVAEPAGASSSPLPRMPTSGAGGRSTRTRSPPISWSSSAWKLRQPLARMAFGYNTRPFADRGICSANSSGLSERDPDAAGYPRATDARQVAAAGTPHLSRTTARSRVVLDEAVILRKIGSSDLMYGQLLHLVEVADLPNVELRILPLSRVEACALTDSFGSCHSARRRQVRVIICSQT